MRKFLPVLLVLAFALVLAQLALAKGQADRVSVSGPGLVEEFSTTRADLVLDLSLGYFETPCRESIGDTALLSEGYAIRRYYQTPDGAFHLHDSFTYYPRAGQQGAVNNVHFTDAASGQTEGWTCASQQGESAFSRLLAQAETQPYLMLAQADGMLRIADPQSLAQIAEIDLSAAYPSHIRSTAGGQTLQYQSIEGAETRDLMLNLETGVQCLQATNLDDGGVERQHIDSYDGRWHAMITPSSNRTIIDLQHMSMGTFGSRTLRTEALMQYSGAWDTNAIRFYLTDGANIYRFEPYNDGRMREQALSLPDVAPLEFAGVVNDIAYLYYPQDGNSPADVPGGIFVINALNGTQIDHLQPEVAFSQVLLADGEFYAVQGQADGAQIYSIARSDGSINAQTSLQGSISDTAYGTLNPSVLGATATPVSLANCPDPTSPFLALHDPLALPQ